MLSKNKIRETNPIFFSIIKNAKKNKQLYHAYLIFAEQKVDTTESTLFLMQAIVCEVVGVIACGECSFCQKIAVNNYIDLKTIDGSKGIIKKEEVITVIADLQQTPLQKNGKKILFIKNIESTNKQSINSLLKFIEEPRKNTYIVMTTNKINAVLSTIKSRSQILRIKPPTINWLKKEIDKKNMPKKYTGLLANIFFNIPDVVEAYNNDFSSQYKIIKQFMKDLLLNKKNASILFKNFFEKNSNFNIYLEILLVYLNDILRIRIDKEVCCVDALNTLKLYKNVKIDIIKFVESILEFKQTIKLRGNFYLAREKLIIEIMGT